MNPNKQHNFPYFRNDIVNWKPHGYEHKVYRNILHTIGNTPLVQLNRLPKDYGLECEIYAKCEFMNPGGSIKDRIAYTMIKEAQNKGLVDRGTRFVEPTSGNTGIGVALATAVLGQDCKCTIVTQDKNSDEKMNTIRLLGAEVVQTPANVPYDDPRSFVSVAKQIRREDPRAITLDQYCNDVNPVTHYAYTAEEILSAVGRVDAVVIGSGTGGTLSGVAHKLKERYPACIVIAVDPLGSTIFGSDKHKSYKVEGIGGEFVPEVLDKSVVDRVEKPTDCESFNMARELIKKEGLLCGGSSGAAMFAAVKAARELNLGAGKRVVVVLADSIRNYMTKFVSDQWMEAHLYKPPPQRNHIIWWNDLVLNMKINTTVPKVNLQDSCLAALKAMGSDHAVALVVDKERYYVGAVSKDNLRYNATNPINDKSMDLNEPISLHVAKHTYKITENDGSPTVGLVSRMLDIAPFVVIVQRDEARSILKDKPRGIVTPEIMMDYIVNRHNE